LESIREPTNLPIQPWHIQPGSFSPATPRPVISYAVPDRLSWPFHKKCHRFCVYREPRRKKLDRLTDFQENIGHPPHVVWAKRRSNRMGMGAKMLSHSFGSENRMCTVSLANT
jgi:hypothetical protein